MSEDRSGFRPKAGETYPTRNGGTGTVLADGLTDGPTDEGSPLCVLIEKGNEKTVVKMLKDGCLSQTWESPDDLMPPATKKKYRPWTLRELEAFVERDGWVRRTDDNMFCCIDRVRVLQNGCVVCNAGGVTFSSSILFTNYTQGDAAKTPCGEEVKMREDRTDFRPKEDWSKMNSPEQELKKLEGKIRRIKNDIHAVESQKAFRDSQLKKTLYVGRDNPCSVAVLPSGKIAVHVWVESSSTPNQLHIVDAQFLEENGKPRDIFQGEQLGDGKAMATE